MPTELIVELVGFNIGVELFRECIELLVFILHRGVDQHQSEFFQLLRGGVLEFAFTRVIDQGAPQFVQARESLDRVVFHPRIFDEANEKHVRR